MTVSWFINATSACLCAVGSLPYRGTVKNIVAARGEAHNDIRRQRLCSGRLGSRLGCRLRKRCFGRQCLLGCRDPGSLGLVGVHGLRLGGIPAALRQASAEEQHYRKPCKDQRRRAQPDILFISAFFECFQFNRRFFRMRRCPPDVFCNRTPLHRAADRLWRA